MVWHSAVFHLASKWLRRPPAMVSPAIPASWAQQSVAQAEHPALQQSVQPAPLSGSEANAWEEACPQPGTASTEATSEAADGQDVALWLAKAQGIANAGGEAKERIKTMEQSFDASPVVQQIGLADAPPSLATGEQGLLSEKIDSLRKAIAAGGVATTSGGVGCALWRAALKANPELASEYKDTGKSYAAQRAFRLKWANEELAAAQVLKSSETGEGSEDSVNGVYLCITRIFKEEGEDDAAVAATFHYVQECTRLHKAGALVKGRPFIAWNKFTKRSEFLYLTKTMRDTFITMRKETKTWDKSAAQDFDSIEVATSIAQ